MGFSEMTGDTNIYVKKFKLDGRDEELVIGQYVDDSLILASSVEAQRWLMERLGKRFPVNASSSGEISFEDPGLLLSMNVRYSRAQGILQFDQRNAIEKLADKLGLKDSPPRSLPIGPDEDFPKLKTAEVDVNGYLSIIGSVVSAPGAGQQAGHRVCCRTTFAARCYTWPGASASFSEPGEVPLLY